jgi:deoxycytidylate deaminase
MTPSRVLRALDLAIEVGAQSPCQKSKRGVVIFHPDRGVMATGFNHPPPGFHCDGIVCRQHCAKVCVHAENDALSKVAGDLEGAELLHTKVADGHAVPTGGPCCWQCSREIANRKLSFIWLFQNREIPGPGGRMRTTSMGELVRYTPDRFHLITLLANNITPVVDDPESRR